MLESYPRQGHSLHTDESSARTQLVPCTMRAGGPQPPYVFWFRRGHPIDTRSSPKYASHTHTHTLTITMSYSFREREPQLTV